jgi:hypothetical protein
MDILWNCLTFKTDILLNWFRMFISDKAVWNSLKLLFWTIQRQILLISNPFSLVFSAWICWYMALNQLNVHEKSLNLTLPNMYERLVRRKKKYLWFQFPTDPIFFCRPYYFFNAIDCATLFSPGGCGLLIQHAKMASVVTLIIEPNCLNSSIGNTHL